MYSSSNVSRKKLLGRPLSRVQSETPLEEPREFPAG